MAGIQHTVELYSYMLYVQAAQPPGGFIRDASARGPTARKLKLMASSFQSLGGTLSPLSAPFVWYSLAYSIFLYLYLVFIHLY